jgi:DNA polymerase-3 subunit gamma/tau
MTFARIVQSGRVVAISALLARIDELLAADGDTPPLTRTAAIPSPEKKNSEPGVVMAADSVRSSESAPAFKVRTPELSSSPGVHAQVAGPGEEVVVAGPIDVRKDWDDFVAYVKDRKDWMAQIIKVCDSVRIQGNELQLKYEDSTQCPILQQSDNLKVLTEFAQDFFQKELHVKVSARGSGAGRGDGEGGAALQEERVALRRDPLALLVAEVFNGHVGDVRTGPRSRDAKVGMQGDK